MAQPRILLINFPESSRKKFLDLGFTNVDVAYIGNISQLMIGKYYTNCYLMPHPPYEYDIFISQTELPDDAKKYITKENETPITNDVYEIVKKVGTGFSFSICFIGKQSTANNLMIAGVPEITLSPSDKRDSVIEHAQKTTFGITELDNYFSDIVNRIDSHYFYISGGERLKEIDSYRIPIFVNKAQKKIGEYGSQYWGTENGCVPKYILLPTFGDNTKIATQLLERIERVIPTFFENTGINSWIKSYEFQPSEIHQIDNEIKKIINERELLIQSAESTKPSILEKYNFFTKILTTDDEHFKGADRLSVNVNQSLRFLGFQTQLTDNQKSADGKRAEDIQIKDDDGFDCVCEVKGTITPNPSPKHINQIQGHMRRTNKKSGLLIINFNYQIHPFRRGKVYADSEQFLPENDSGIGIISTVDLFRILKDRKENKITEKQAKSILKQGGRIEYPKSN